MSPVPVRSMARVALVVIVSLSAAACGGDQDKSLAEAEDTLQEYLESVANGDADACELESKDYADENAEFFDEKDCEERIDASQVLYDAFDVDLTDAEYSSSEGDSDEEAIVTISYDDSEESYRLVYEDGKWLVDDELDGDSDESGDSGEGLDEDGDEGEADAVLPLTEGSTLTLPGSDDSGTVSEDTPFTVVFDTMTCAPKIPKAAYDENYEPTDLVADEGNQICIVELAVTNDSKGPATFSSVDDANIRTSDGTEFSETDEDFDDQGFLASKDRDPSYTSDNVQPGQTKYDVVAYELPLDAEPVELVYDRE